MHLTIKLKSMHKPKLWKARREAIRLIREEKWSHSKVARHFGYHRTTITRWYCKWFYHGKVGFHNFSNRPKTLHPKTTLWEHQLLVRTIRKETGFCHQKIKIVLEQEHGLKLSLSTIYRILKKSGYIKIKKRYQRKKRQIPYIFRPKEAGKLIQLDTKQLKGKYQYTFVDCATRYPVAYLTKTISMKRSIEVLKEAIKEFPFKALVIQTDNGPEFQSEFVNYCHKSGLSHRYIRIRKAQDNSIVERLHRTIDEEFYFGRNLNITLEDLNSQLQKYLVWHRTKRIHLGLNGLTPQQKLEQLKTVQNI
jgi:transposase